MTEKEKLRIILKNIKDKKLTPNAFHINELVPTIDDSEYIDEYYKWEYKIGEDILKIQWDIEDFADFFTIDLNDANMYFYGWLDKDYKNSWNTGNWDIFSDYDADAEELFKIILQHGGVLEKTREQKDNKGGEK